MAFGNRSKRYLTPPFQLNRQSLSVTDRAVIHLRSMSLQGSIKFLNQLQPQDGISHYQIDVSDLGYVTPFGMLICSFGLSQFRYRHDDCDFDLVGANGKSYAAHMGFFRAFGADYGNAPGNASGNKNYLPLSILRLDELREKARTDMTVVQNVIEARAHQLASVLVRDENSDLARTLGYAMTEIFRNVLEHSGATQLGYCAQYWPSKNRVEVAILDGGKGVRAALSQNPFLEIEDDRHALHLAILPGVSGKVFEGVRTDPYDHWAHSGFGLYMTSSICRNGGTFFICSGQSGIELRGDQKRSFDLPLPGTALRLIISPTKVKKLGDTLDELSKAGEEIAKGIKGAIVNASAASTMVRENRPRWPEADA